MFRNLVRSCRYRYEESKKFQKLEVARTVVLKVREAGGRFLTFDRKVKLYFDVGDTKALAKASQALRDSVYDIQKDGEGGNNGKPRIVPVSLVQLAPVGEAPILPVGGDEKKVEETAGKSVSTGRQL